ncbi:proline dehydrogenase family protein [Actibacterium sp. XHP0104]|uniref:proline dehydrogenase family protein n=1 Tax=Actibacterium sp. XHP0104 TaxID=2984335 RepID=UPI0021E996ED|nr:proline dehydrogenase family protein [Actibacterium sp. XHP0104]MCV2882128.1 proline dehydrogenase family protein [Actibacterium sp. XHP0104]
MLRKAWQSGMIAMARSPRIKTFMQNSRATSFLSEKYVSGKSVQDGVRRAQALMAEQGVRSSLFYMGEYVDTLDRVEENVENKLNVARALSETALDIHVSVDPTQIGHHVDPALVEERALKIAAEIGRGAEISAGQVHCLMFDMEDASLNDPTIRIHNLVQDRGYPTALTLQAYLRRTEADLRAQILRGSKVRLVKGAFAANADIAFQSRAEIKDNSRKLISMMLSPQAKEAGFYPIIATHDTNLHEFAIARARENGWQPGDYEFEMLLGVREDVARALAERGERIRLYVPFGHDWWPHAVRRIGENPANAVLLARSLVS